MPLPKRYYDQIDDGAPGEDDARYASETYNTMTALPPGLSRSQPPQHQSSSSSSSSQSHASSSQQQPQQPFQPRPMIPLPSTSNVNLHYDASQFAPVSYSVTPPLSIPAVPAIPPPPPALSAHAGFPAIPPLQSPVLPSRSGHAPGPADASTSASGSGSAEDMVANRPRRRIIPPDAPAHSVMDDDEETYTYTLTDELRATMFRSVHGRQLNTMQPVYQLPADADEIKREEYFHKLMYMVYGDKLWVGPLEEVLSAPSDRNRRVLDIGCGSGIWAIQIADEFPDVEIIGCDLAPIQPDMVPPNCDFELWDAQLNPYPDEYFDVVHARGVHTGIRNYPLFLEEIARVLAPGGLIILVESEIRALTEGKTPIDAGPRGGAPGWHAFWEQYRRCLQGNHIDTTVPTRLGALVRVTDAFEEIVAQEATLPVGFWPKDDNMLAVGEHAWMDHDRFVPGVRPLFLNYGLSEFRVKILVEDAQQDLYYPLTRPYTCVHVSHARKVVSWQAPRRRRRRLR
ncbi:hypothetical protein ACEPAI_4710 [Sanghuangporus weigelae]